MSAFEISRRRVGEWPDLPCWRDQPPDLWSVFEAGGGPGNHVHLVWGEQRLTFDDVRERVDRLRGWLVANGVEPGDRVAIASANRPEWVIAFWATVGVGAVVVGINGWWTAAEMARAVERTQPKVVVADGPRAALLEGHASGAALVSADGGRGTPFDAAQAPAAGASPSIDPDDPALIFFTSGTTAEPKAPVTTHRAMGSALHNIAFATARGLEAAGVTEPPPPPTSFITSPMFHVAGCHAGLVLGWATGQRLVLPAGGLDARRLADVLGGEEVAHWPAVPALVWRLVHHGRAVGASFPALDRLSFGGAPTPPSLIDACRDVFPNVGTAVATGWGMTETAGALTSSSGPAFADDPSRVGVPYPTVELAFGERDEVLVRSVQVTPRWWDDPTPTTDADGWFPTGDAGRLGPDGALHLTDRLDDVIDRGGERVSAAEVENVLLAHPGVAEASVVAVPHPTLGSDIAAVVVGRDGSLTATDVQRFAAEHLAAFKVPARVEMRSEPLPRTATGKIRRRDL